MPEVHPLAKIIFGGLIAGGLILTLPMDMLIGVFVFGCAIPLLFLGSVYWFFEGLYELAERLFSGSEQTLKSRVDHWREQFNRDPSVEFSPSPG